MELKKAEYALALYLFYYDRAKFQQTNQPWATVAYCSKGLGWGERQVRFARNNLKSLGLIEDIRPEIGSKTYTRLNFITTENTLSSIFHDPCTSAKGHKSATQSALKIKKNKCLKNKKGIIKDNSSPDGQGRPKPKIESKKLPKIVIKKKEAPESDKPSKNPPKADYVHTISDLRNYNELTSNHNATKHRAETRAEIDTLDRLHALFSDRCDHPYLDTNIPEEYIKYKWDMDTLIDVFKYQLDHAANFGRQPIRNIGQFILFKSFTNKIYDAKKTWSPLVYWHLKLNKAANGELTEDGKKFLSSLNRAKIRDVETIEGEVVNLVAKSFYSVIHKYELMDGSDRSMTYPFGMIDCLSKYIKDQGNRYEFKLVYIRKDGFVDEFLANAVKLNVIKKKIYTRSIY